MYCCPIWEEKSIYVPVQYVFLIVLTLIVSIGTVGVPGTSTVTTTALFTAAGLPVEIIVLLVPISSVVDMMRKADLMGGNSQRYLELFVDAAIIYGILIIIVSLLGRLLEKRFTVAGKETQRILISEE